jgi:hypothetical protein
MQPTNTTEVSNIIPFGPRQVEYLNTLMIGRHLTNLVETYGEERVLDILIEIYGLEIKKKAG